MESRFQGVPIIVLTDAKTKEGRCVNGLHVQTFVENPFGDHPAGSNAADCQRCDDG